MLKYFKKLLGPPKKIKEPVAPGTLLRLEIDYSDTYFTLVNHSSKPPIVFKEYMMYVETKKREYIDGIHYKHIFLKANGAIDELPSGHKHFFIEDYKWFERVEL